METPLAYASRRISEGKYPSIQIHEAGGQFFLQDADGNDLKHPVFTKRYEAEDLRSRVNKRSARHIL